MQTDQALERESNPFTESAYATASVKTRSFLYPFNRRLRHLVGISIRNINTSPQSGVRSRATDDELLPQTWKSSTKHLADEEINRLSHSRSTTDLSGAATSTNSTSKVSQKIEDGLTPPTRPQEWKIRRRSTLNWTGASPRARQRKLEQVSRGRIVDTFFSLHSVNSEEPIYVSETNQSCMNPDFLLFDLNGHGPSVTRSDECIVKLWTKADSDDEYCLLVELHVNLQSLYFLGKELDHHHGLLPQNCIVFRLSDGIYTSFADMPGGRPPSSPAFSSQSSVSGHVQTTASFNTLMRLATLDDCIQDALRTRAKLAVQIDELITRNKNASKIFGDAKEIEIKVEEIEKLVETQKAKLERTGTEKRDLEASLYARRRALDEGLEAQNLADGHKNQATSEQEQIRRDVATCFDKIAGQTRRICEDISSIFPIEPIPNRPLSFNIRTLPLPNSSFENADDETTSAGLGYVSQAVQLLSCYLLLPLPYPLVQQSSTSSIEDQVAIMAGSRVYPLYMRNSIPFRFEYGVFLLNKNIEFLMSGSGLRAVDVRQTLPNLKYLLYVLTAGKGELPMRKAGGIRGLTGGYVSHQSSRRGSEDEPLKAVHSKSLAANARFLTRLQHVIH